jgi:hypothetical protein
VALIEDFGGDGSKEVDPEDEDLGLYGIPPFRALRTLDHLYVEYATGERELYDRRADPDELDNLIATADPALLSRLAGRLVDLRDCAGAACRVAEDAPLADDAPLPTIVEAPVAPFAVGQRLTFRGGATDGVGTTLSESALTWTVLLRHEAHTHPVGPPTTGGSVTFSAPAPEDLLAAGTTYLEVRLTATDATGRSRTVARNLRPNLVDLVFVTEPAGLTLRIDGAEVATPAQVRSWEGYPLRIEAPDQRGDRQVMVWTGWSHGGGGAQTLVTPATPAVYTATFVADDTG